MFTNLFCSYHFLTSPFSHTTQILRTSQLTPLHLQTPLHSLLQLCFPLKSFFSSNGWGLKRKWWKQTGVRREEEKKKTFQEIMFAEFKSGRMRDWKEGDVIKEGKRMEF
jgi:hypothetical protein